MCKNVYFVCFRHNIFLCGEVFFLYAKDYCSIFLIVLAEK